MQVTINIINEMKKLRNSTYSDRYTWVDELIQNCQRSGATHINVKIDYYDYTITVSDNGCGCDNPQALFEKSTSDWDDTVVQNESPFGEGFFSTMMAADTINVKSVGFNALFDVNKMFAENTVDVIEVTKNRKKSGFTVTLSDLRSDVSLCAVEERFKETAKYIKCPTTSINGETVHYEGLNPDIDHPFLRKIDTPMFRGWIHPHTYSRDGWQDPKIRTFAYYRKVIDLPNFYGINGVLNIKDNVVGLRSPDRHDFIHDDRYEEMLRLLREEIKAMYIKILEKGTDADIKDYQSRIEQYVDMDEYAPLIKYKIMDPPVTKSEDSIACAVNTETDDNSEIIDSSPDYDDYEMNDETEEETTSPNTSRITNINDTEIEHREDIQTETNVLSKKESTPKKEKQTGNKIAKLKYGFYINPEEMNTYRDAIDIAQYYDIPIIEIRNKLESNCISSYENIKHISDLIEMVSLKAEFSNMEPNSPAEIRAYKILNTIGRVIAGNEKLFAIADTNIKKVLDMSDKEYVMETVDALATAYAGTIYIDRKHMREYKELNSDSNSLTETDMKFILINLETIAHEMSHVLYHTEDNTKEHYAKTNYIMQEIIQAIYNVNYAISI